MIRPDFLHSSMYLLILVHFPLSNSIVTTNANSIFTLTLRVLLLFLLLLRRLHERSQHCLFKILKINRCDSSISLLSRHLHTYIYSHKSYVSRNFEALNPRYVYIRFCSCYHDVINIISVICRQIFVSLRSHCLV